MEITGKAGAALFSLQQALQQPQNIVTQLTGEEVDQNQAQPESSGNAKLQKAAALQSGKGTTINILA